MIIATLIAIANSIIPLEKDIKDISHNYQLQILNKKIINSKDKIVFNKNNKKNNKKNSKNEESKYLIQYIIDEKKDFSCEKVFELRKKNRIKRYIILDVTLKKEVETCYKLFNLNKQYKKAFNNKIIWYITKYWIFSWMNSRIRMSDYKSILKRKNIKLRIIKYSKDKEYYMMYLYNNMVDDKAFSWIEVKKDHYLVSKNQYFDYLKFKKYINKNIEKYLIERKKFYEKTWIKQNVYNVLSEDSIKCNSYTLVEFRMFNDFLIDLIYNYRHKIEIQNKLIKEYQSKNKRKEYFDSIDKFRKEINKKYHYKWWKTEDVLKYLNKIYYSFENNWKRKYLVYAHLNIQDLINPFSNFLYIKSWLTTYHSWLRLCSIYSCYQYWPEQWYWDDRIKHKFMWINRTVRNDINIIYLFI